MQAVKRVFVIVFLLGTGAAPGLAQDELRDLPPRPLTSALMAAQDGRWIWARGLAERSGPAGPAIIDWMRLRAGHGTPREVLEFLDTHEDFPGLDRMIEQAEASLEDASDAEVLALFATQRPQTGTGALRLAEAQIAAGKQGDAEAGLVMAWRTLDLSTAEHDKFLARHAPLLADHHAARLDMAEWRGLKDVALMRPLVSEAHQALSELRDKVKRGGDPTEELAKLPKMLQDDPLLSFRRFERLLDIGRTDEAMALTVAQSRSDKGLGMAERWASWRRALARRMMREENYDTAYALASVHGLDGGGNFADLEFLSGYLALRFLDEAELARDHFQRLSAAVNSPISRGRAGYWLGRAQEALGDAEGAQVSYEAGAEHPTSFYGLLAAEKAGVALPEDLGGRDALGDWRQAEFAKSLPFQAGVLLARNGQDWYAEMFLTDLARRLDGDDLARLGQALDEMGDPHLQVMTVKAAASGGVVANAPYYPLHPMKEMDLPIDTEMALAIARRESEFDFSVRSHAGAEGLMQVMPGTARDVARDSGVGYDPEKVRNDWRYNARLGAAYLAQMAERFDGNVLLVSAAYNAGPHRADQWIESLGDPRDEAVDLVDWVEHIPFRETRNYVQRVAESLPIYRARLGLEPLPQPFSQELSGRSLTPDLATSN
ncbi:transglycosylase SLT domain-containing protein [Roseovarius sp. C7]|uniref:lytic transglycosylase domain-containing protein n=1 Tax=Roseovarius sp. C7 TaxID=3398643 RepID=UPI0039F6ABD9